MTLFHVSDRLIQAMHAAEVRRANAQRLYAGQFTRKDETATKTRFASDADLGAVSHKGRMSLSNRVNTSL